MGYKMKGFSGFKPSPAKVSDDEAVVEAQNKLDHVELDYKTPGWAKAASKVLAPLDKKISKYIGGKISKKGGKNKKVKTDFTIEGIDDTKNKLKTIDTTDINVFNK